MHTGLEADSPSISRYTTLRALPGKRDDLALALTPLLDSARLEQGLTEYSLHASEDHPDELWIFARFQDPAAFDEHERREQVASTPEVLTNLLPLLAGPADTVAGRVLWTLPRRPRPGSGSR